MDETVEVSEEMKDKEDLDEEASDTKKGQLKKLTWMNYLAELEAAEEGYGNGQDAKKKSLLKRLYLKKK